MQKVKLIHHQYLSAPNGANTVMNALLNSKEQFARNEIEISSLTPDLFAPRSFSPSDQKQIKYNLRAKIKQLLKSATKYSRLAADIMIYITEIRPAKKIIKAYLAMQPAEDEVAFFHTLVPCYYYLKQRTHNQPVVVVCHTNGDNFKMSRIYYPALERSRVYKKLKQMEDYVLRNANAINFVSRLSARNFVELHPDVDPNKVSYIYNGVPDIIRAAESNDRSNVLEICCVASVSKRKGQHYIVEALERFNKDERPRVHFTIVGDGPDRNALEERVKRAGLNNYITFAGVSQNVDSYLVNSDIYILPSEDEGLPMAIIEAMRASLPIVSTPVGGIPEMVEDKTNGVMINPCSDDIYHLLRDIEKYDWAEMGKNARKTYEEKFTVEKMVDGYINLLKF